MMILGSGLLFWSTFFSICTFAVLMTNKVHIKRAVDIGYWLKELGYDLDSLVPPVTYSGQVGVSRQSSDVDDDDDDDDNDVSVTSAFRCAYDSNAARFAHLSTVAPSLVTTADAGLRAADVAGASPYVFGVGVLLTVSSAAANDDDTPREKVNSLIVSGT